MSRHLRRIERTDSGRKNRVVPESAWPGGLVSLELHANVARFTGVLAAVGQGIKRASDIDHAVALEREAIAQMVGRCAEVVRDNPFEFRFGGRAEADRLWNIAEDIRNGAHHANTPPNAQERGQE